MTDAPTTPTIHFGQRSIDGLPQSLCTLAGGPARVLLIADPALGYLGLLPPLLSRLAEAGHIVDTHEPPLGEPTAQDIDLARLRCRAHAAEIVVGLGGGSALDTAKLVAALSADDAPVTDYACGRRPLPPRPVSLVCVPTTAGTGAEVTGVAVLSDLGTKLWIAGPGLRPDLALLDPTLTVSLPAGLTAATGIDALVHAMEAATNRSGDPVARRYSLAAIRMVRRALPRALADGNDLHARGGLMRAACAAGIGIDRAGTAMAHCIGHALASCAAIPHGRAVGLGMAATLAWCAMANQTAFAQVTAALGGPADAEAAHDTFRAFALGCGMTGELGDGFARVGVAELAERMADPENAPMRTATVRTASAEDMMRFARTLLSGRALA